MKIYAVSIDNFRGISSTTLVLPDHAVLIGDNNTGKSSVLEAIDLALGPDRLSRRPPVDEHDFSRATISPSLQRRPRKALSRIRVRTRPPVRRRKSRLKSPSLACPKSRRPGSAGISSGSTSRRAISSLMPIRRGSMQRTLRPRCVSPSSAPMTRTKTILPAIRSIRAA